MTPINCDRVYKHNSCYKCCKTCLCFHLLTWLFMTTERKNKGFNWCDVSHAVMCRHGNTETSFRCFTHNTDLDVFFPLMWQKHASCFALNGSQVGCYTISACPPPPVSDRPTEYGERWSIQRVTVKVNQYEVTSNMVRNTLVFKVTDHGHYEESINGKWFTWLIQPALQRLLYTLYIPF